MAVSLPKPHMKQEKDITRVMVDVEYWACSCGRELGKGAALRAVEMHGKIICGKCAQKESPVYQEWLNSFEGARYLRRVGAV